MRKVFSDLSNTTARCVGLSSGFMSREQLPQHVAEAEHGIDLQAVGFAGERRQRVIGAEDVARAVDQEDVVALLQAPAETARRLRGAGLALAAWRADFLADFDAGMAGRMWAVRRAMATRGRWISAIRSVAVSCSPFGCGVCYELSRLGGAIRTPLIPAQAGIQRLALGPLAGRAAGQHFMFTEVSMHIAMIGSGYVGLVSGACFADFGHQVICVDKDARKIDALQPGRDADLRARPVGPGRQQCAAGPAVLLDRAEGPVAEADAVFIAVGTPSRRGDGHADLTYVYDAAREIAQALDGFTVVVTKSTVPVGTGDEVERIMRETRAGCRFRGRVQSGIPARRRGDPRLQASRPHRHRHRRRARARR